MTPLSTRSDSSINIKVGVVTYFEKGVLRDNEAVMQMLLEAFTQSGLSSICHPVIHAQFT